VRKGLFTSNETEILFDDKNYDRKVRKPRISFVPQKYRETILGWYSIRKNLEIPLLASNKSEEFIENRINQICNELGYESRESFFSNFGFFENENTLKSKMPSQLSGGQQQILVLLRSLVVNPSVLVLDEPFSALDIYKGNQFRKNLLTYLVENEILTIFISHDLEEIVDMADKIIFMQPVQDNSSIAGIENVNINRNGANLDKDESKNFMKKMKEKYLEPNG
jgi:NitT/TauT family transport system ATP-binding protein